MKFDTIIFYTALIILLILPLPAAGADGEIWTAWVEGEGEQNPIFIGRFDGRRWEKEIFPHYDRFLRSFTPAPGIDPDGRLWLVWAARTSKENPVLYWSRRDGAGWLEPRRVTGDPESWEYAPALAFNARGEPRLVWSQLWDGSTEIFTAGWNGENFSAPSMISTPDGSPDSDPALTFSPRGEMTAVWQGCRNGRALIYTSRMVKNRWSKEAAVTDNNGTDQTRPQINYRSGNFRITWQEKNRRFSRVLAGKKQTPPRRLVEAGLPGEDPPRPRRGCWVLKKTTSGSWETDRYQPRFPLIRGTGAAGTKAGKRAATVSLYLIGYGDSITYGHDSGGDTSRWYAAFLDIDLEAAHSFRNYYFYNEGYPGALTSELLYGGGAWGCPGINDVIADHPLAQTILIMGGTNDVADPIPLTTIAYNLGELIDRADNRGLTPVLSTIIPRVNDSTNFTRSTNLSIDYIPPLADAHNCLLADPFSLFMFYYPSDYFWEELYGYGTPNWDGTHPHWPVGDDTIADGWFAALSDPPVNLILDSGDYDGDGSSDYGIFRPATGLWAIRGVTRCYFGDKADLPASGDYNNDGTTEIAVFRPETGLWAIRGITRFYYGTVHDRSVPGDYNGDGSCEAAIWRSRTGLWGVRGFTRCYYGSSGDTPIPAYYQPGRSKNIAVFRPALGLWAVRDVSRFYYGDGDDQPAPARYNGSGNENAAVFRSGNGLWAVRHLTRFYYGRPDDKAAPAPYDGATAGGAIFRESSGLWAVRGETRLYFGAFGDEILSAGRPRPLTPTPSPTISPPPTPSTTPTPSPSPSIIPPPPITPTPSPTPSSSPTASPTPTPTVSPTPTVTPTPSPVL